MNAGYVVTGALALVCWVLAVRGLIRGHRASGSGYQEATESRKLRTSIRLLLVAIITTVALGVQLSRGL